MTECGQCGDCCENLQLNFTKRQMRAFLAEHGGERGGPIARDHAANASFILEHWHRSGGGGTATRYSCDAFDPATRLCRRHDERPPICRGYPWYGAPPGNGTMRLSPRCSFNADLGIPVEIRSTPTASPDRSAA